MILAIDIGNTQTKLGVFENNILKTTYSFYPEDDINNKIEELSKFNFKNVIISSVVPKLTPLYKNIIFNLYNIKAFEVSYDNCKINLNVTEPQTVGADRICNVSAVLNLYTTPTIIIDFGTATTYDVINKKGDFIGGIIAPGVLTSAKYLIDNAALLSETDLQFPKNTIGLDTKQNIQSGIMYGALDQVSGMISRINLETKVENNIILTGGFSEILSPHLLINHILDKNLTLKGMKFINESNN